MPTSGSTDYTVTAGQIVTEALRAIGLRVSDTADTFGTAAATLVAAALRSIGISAPTTAASITATQSSIVARALRLVGVSNPSSTQTTNATTACVALEKSWLTKGLVVSGTNYEVQWSDALTLALYKRLAPEYGKAVDGALAAEAQASFLLASSVPSIPADTNAAAALSRIAALWEQYGTITSGGSYSNRWAPALVYETAIQSALENGRPVPEAVAAMAKRTFEEARAFSKVDDGLRALNLMLKAWQQRGLQTWVRKSHNWTLVSGTASYVIGPTSTVAIGTPVRIVGAFLRDSSDFDSPLTLVSKSDWFSISDKSSAGTPSQVYYEKGITTGTLYTWPIIDTTGYDIYIDFQRPIEDLDATTDTLDMPQGAYEAVKYGLAVRLAAQNDRKVSEEVAALSQKLEADLFDTSAEFYEFRVEPDIG